MKQFIANVRVRKQNRSGNTYHDVDIMAMNGESFTRADKVYGCGNHYKQTTADLMNTFYGVETYTYLNIDDYCVFIVNNY